MVTNPLRINLTKNSKLEGNGMIVFWKGYYCKNYHPTQISLQIQKVPSTCQEHSPQKYKKKS